MYNTVPIGSRVCGEDLWGEYTAIPDHATVPNGSRICGEEIPAHASVMCMYLNINTGMALTGDHTMCKYVLATDAAPFGDRTIWTVPDGIHIASEWAVHKVNRFCGKEMLVECAVPNGNRICGDEITAHASVPNGGHVFGETNKIHGNPTLPQADESRVCFMVLNGSHVLCGEEILAERAILHATHICDEEMCADRAVPNGSRVFAVDDLHIVQSPLGATSVVGCGDEIPAHASVPNGSRVYVRDDETLADVMVPHGSRVVIKYQFLFERRSPMGVASVVRRCFHITRSPVGAASVVKNDLHMLRSPMGAISVVNIHAESNRQSPMHPACVIRRCVQITWSPMGAMSVVRRYQHTRRSPMGAMSVVRRYQHTRRSPMGAVSVVKRCFHGVRSPVGAASVAKTYLHPCTTDAAPIGDHRKRGTWGIAYISLHEYAMRAMCAVKSDLYTPRSPTGATSVGPNYKLPVHGMVPNGSCVCNEDVRIYDTVPNGSRVCDEDIWSHICSIINNNNNNNNQPTNQPQPQQQQQQQQQYLTMQRSPMRTVYVVRLSQHIPRSPMGAVFVVQVNTPTHDTVPNGSHVDGVKQQTPVHATVPYGSRLHVTHVDIHGLNVEPRAALPPPAPVICVRVRVMLTDEAGPITWLPLGTAHTTSIGSRPYQGKSAFYDPLTAEEGPIGSRAIHTSPVGRGMRGYAEWVGKTRIGGASLFSLAKFIFHGEGYVIGSAIKHIPMAGRDISQFMLNIQHTYGRSINRWA
ncbi:hypothetical protein BD769DRAFT_1394828 [Suillus cothurnatus]|nr:hypothetical protein BD769DRAFT_1394828 [Suillus cothurnatus]